MLSPGGHSVISGYIFVVAAVATMVRRESFLLYQVPEPRTATGISILDSEDRARLPQMKEHLLSVSRGLGNLSAPLSLSCHLSSGVRSSREQSDVWVRVVPAHSSSSVVPTLSVVLYDSPTSPVFVVGVEDLEEYSKVLLS